jgi:hypothetical protein
MPPPLVSEDDVTCAPIERGMKEPVLPAASVHPAFEFPVSTLSDVPSATSHAGFESRPARLDQPETIEMQQSKRSRKIVLFLILASVGLSVLWGAILVHSNSGAMTDFKALYYGARCLIQHADPYRESEFLRVYLADGGTFPTDPVTAGLFRRAVLVCVNMPTALFLTIPFAHLPLLAAFVLWTLLMAATLVVAAFLIWDVAATKSSGISLFQICFLLANCVILFYAGNAAGIVVGLCVVAVWCFLQDRFAPAGILCLALSLVIKPHDAGLVWLYFLLAGGVYRKRALQTLLVAAAISLPAVLWVSQVIPQWLPELRSNLQAASARGGLNDPGPAAIGFHHPDPIVDLQTFVSVFRDDPRIYVPASFLVTGTLLLLWGSTTLRSPISQRKAWLALAAIAALTLLITYHREHDAKLLLLTIPACAMLCAERGPVGWLALLGNSAAVFITADIPATALAILTAHTTLGVGLLDHLRTALLVRPAPIVLLVVAVFYLWVYVRSPLSIRVQTRSAGVAPKSYGQTI